MDKVPYMQRGGAWDNSDLAAKNKKKMPKPTTTVVKNDKVSKKIVPTKWSSTDKQYANVRRYAVASQRVHSCSVCCAVLRICKYQLMIENPVLIFASATDGPCQSNHACSFLVAIFHPLRLYL